MRAWLVGALCLCNCLNDSHDLAFRVGPGFTPEQHGLLGQAAERWNRVAVRKIRFSSTGSLRIRLSQLPPDQDGRAAGNTIYIRPGHDSHRFLVVAVHEMGHALGLDHVTKGVMDPQGTQLEFSAEDLAECHDVGACE